MIIARWVNEDRTQYAVLENDGSIAIANRRTSADIWGPPKKLQLEGGFPSSHDFVTTCMLQGNRQPKVTDAT
jgi:hypothetical protein